MGYNKKHTRPHILILIGPAELRIPNNNSFRGILLKHDLSE